jgi:predicted nuclease of predicted toxin-antitoxin system
MKIRFQADADLNEDILTGVARRVPEIDFQTATQAGLSGVRDEQVLEIAARENRVLVSHDWETMPYHFAEFVTARTSPGVLIVPQKLGVNRSIEELIMIWSVSEAEEYVNSIRRIPL